MKKKYIICTFGYLYPYLCECEILHAKYPHYGNVNFAVTEYYTDNSKALNIPDFRSPNSEFTDFVCRYDVIRIKNVIAEVSNGVYKLKNGGYVGKFTAYDRYELFDLNRKIRRKIPNSIFNEIIGTDWIGYIGYPYNKMIFEADDDDGALKIFKEKINEIDIFVRNSSLNSPMAECDSREDFKRCVIIKCSDNNSTVKPLKTDKFYIDGQILNLMKLTDTCLRYNTSIADDSQKSKFERLLGFSCISNIEDFDDIISCLDYKDLDGIFWPRVAVRYTTNKVSPISLSCINPFCSSKKLDIDNTVIGEILSSPENIKAFMENPNLKMSSSHDVRFIKSAIPKSLRRSDMKMVKFKSKKRSDIDEICKS